MKKQPHFITSALDRVSEEVSDTVDDFFTYNGKEKRISEIKDKLETIFSSELLKSYELGNKNAKREEKFWEPAGIPKYFVRQFEFLVQHPRGKKRSGKK